MILLKYILKNNNGSEISQSINELVEKEEPFPTKKKVNKNKNQRINKIIKLVFLPNVILYIL